MAFFAPDAAVLAADLGKLSLDSESHFAIREGGKTVGSGVITEADP